MKDLFDLKIKPRQPVKARGFVLLAEYSLIKVGVKFVNPPA